MWPSEKRGFRRMPQKPERNLVILSAFLVTARKLLQETGGEGGIRTPGRSFSPYNGLANRRIQPLCHLSAVGPAEKNRPNKTQYSIKSTQGRVRFSRRIFLFG